MKHKRLNRDGWGFQFYPYYQMRIDTDFYKGLACVIKMTDGEPNYWATSKAGRLQVSGAGMTWLQLVPDNTKRLITVKYFPQDSHDPERKNYPEEFKTKYRPSVWYVDITEGIEYDDDGIAVYIDKYLDVIFTPEGEVKVADRDELDEAYNAGDVTKEQYDDALNECDNVVKDLCEDIPATNRWCSKIMEVVDGRIAAGEKVTLSHEFLEPRSLLESSYNTRDLGNYLIEGTLKYTRTKKILRSDGIFHPSEKDIEFLKSAGITTFIDLRTEGETERKPHGLKGMDGFEYHNLSILEGSGIPESVEAVPASYARIAHSKSITKVFEIIANAEGGVMYGCTAGKDRTGVVSALILWLCGVSKSDIVYDYMVTKINNRDRFELFHKKFPEVDMNIVIPRENNIAEFMRLIEEEHSSVEGYFEALGIDKDMQSRIRAMLLD